MNGTVAPSSSSATAAATCSSRTASSLAICRSMEVVTHTPIAKETLRGSGADAAAHLRGHAYGGRRIDSTSPRRGFHCDRDGQGGERCLGEMVERSPLCENSFLDDG